MPILLGLDWSSDPDLDWMSDLFGSVIVLLADVPVDTIATAAD
jgi:hypothetical protein